MACAGQARVAAGQSGGAQLPPSGGSPKQSQAAAANLKPLTNARLEVVHLQVGRQRGPVWGDQACQDASGCPAGCHLPTALARPPAARTGFQFSSKTTMRRQDTRLMPWVPALEMRKTCVHGWVQGGGAGR